MSSDVRVSRTSQGTKAPLQLVPWRQQNVLRLLRTKGEIMLQVSGTCIRQGSFSRLIAIAALIASPLGFCEMASAQESCPAEPIYACVNDGSRLARIVDAQNQCSNSEHLVCWPARGGPAGTSALSGSFSIALVKKQPSTEALSAYGIIDFSSGPGGFAFARDGSVGISAVNLISDGRVEVVFSDPDYTSLESTVIVSSRGSTPRFISWDSFGSNSVSVSTFE